VHVWTVNNPTKVFVMRFAFLLCSKHKTTQSMTRLHSFFQRTFKLVIRKVFGPGPHFVDQATPGYRCSEYTTGGHGPPFRGMNHAPPPSSHWEPWPWHWPDMGTLAESMWGPMDFHSKFFTIWYFQKVFFENNIGFAFSDFETLYKKRAQFHSFQGQIRAHRKTLNLKWEKHLY